MLGYRLRHRVEFQKSINQVIDGENVQSFETVILDDGTILDDVPAECLLGAGREAAASGSVYADTSVRINLRWFPGLDSSWRILWGDRALDILEVSGDLSARREYRLRCVDSASQGL
jgi:head-tail adaptor